MQFFRFDLQLSSESSVCRLSESPGTAAAIAASGVTLTGRGPRRTSSWTTRNGAAAYCGEERIACA